MNKNSKPWCPLLKIVEGGAASVAIVQAIKSNGEPTRQSHRGKGFTQ
jgi:hypothetical protein